MQPAVSHSKSLSAHCLQCTLPKPVSPNTTHDYRGIPVHFCTTRSGPPAQGLLLGATLLISSRVPSDSSCARTCIYASHTLCTTHSIAEFVLLQSLSKSVLCIHSARCFKDPYVSMSFGAGHLLRTLGSCYHNARSAACIGMEAAMHKNHIQCKTENGLKWHSPTCIASCHQDALQTLRSLCLRDFQTKMQQVRDPPRTLTQGGCRR